MIDSTTMNLPGNTKKHQERPCTLACSPTHVPPSLRMRFSAVPSLASHLAALSIFGIHTFPVMS